MREIKFRGKRINNVGWTYGYYTKHETRQICPIGDDKLQPSEIKHLIVIDSFADWNMPRRLEGIEVIPETVGQYTGLKDKNGVEIYEGDILKDTLGWVYEVRWDEEGSRFLGHHSKPRGDTYVCYIGREPKSEIIGNIHDNPELLEVWE